MGNEPLIVLDTHALVWWYDRPDRLSDIARRSIRLAVRDGGIVISAISILEISTAVRRGRLDLGMPAGNWFDDLQKMPELRIEPVNVAIAHAAGSLPDTLHGDPADRIIVATALVLKGRLVTADKRVRESGLIETLW